MTTYSYKFNGGENGVTLMNSCGKKVTLVYSASSIFLDRIEFAKSIEDREYSYSMIQNTIKRFMGE